jgi:hypothetical protein
MSSIGVPDVRQRGRFGVAESAARCVLKTLANPGRTRPIIDESRKDLDMGVEVNLQLCALSLKSNHLQVLSLCFVVGFFSHLKYKFLFATSLSLGTLHGAGHLMPLRA